MPVKIPGLFRYRSDRPYCDNCKKNASSQLVPEYMPANPQKIELRLYFNKNIHISFSPLGVYLRCLVAIFLEYIPLSHSFYRLKKKAELPKELSFGSSAIFYLLIRPAAFRTLLTKGLALSGNNYLKNTILD